ncbi:hypothetical protein BH09BAC5_BH09BAC5_17030 [soil metagenome]
MKKYVTILLLFFVLFSSCGEKDKKTVVIHAEELEGYWVSGFLLHNTELTRTIAMESGKEVGGHSFRLKNSINGFEDTSYSINGDTLIYRLENTVKYEAFDSIVQKYDEDFKKYIIVFHSRDRLILRDLKSNEDITLYNISIIPSNNEKYTRMEFGRIILLDSVFLGDKKFSKKIALDKVWQENLDFLAQKINWENAIFLRQASITKKFKDGSFYYIEPKFKLIEITSEKHFGRWENCGNGVSDAAISCLILEMVALEQYCLNNNLLFAKT